MHPERTQPWEDFIGWLASGTQVQRIDAKIQATGPLDRPAVGHVKGLEDTAVRQRMEDATAPEIRQIYHALGTVVRCAGPENARLGPVLWDRARRLMHGLLPEALVPVPGTPLVVREGDEKDVALNGNVDQIILEWVERKPPCETAEGRAAPREHAKHGDHLGRAGNEAARQRGGDLPKLLDGVIELLPRLRVEGRPTHFSSGASRPRAVHRHRAPA